jgi:hypothetical protein
VQGKEMPFAALALVPRPALAHGRTQYLLNNEQAESLSILKFMVK